jgi:UDP-2,3-diacylglucosamine hydrolase
MRDASQKNNNNKKESIMDVTPTAIEDFFEQHHIDLLIHGHTHRPMTHKHNTGTRIVLGDWHETGWCLMLDEQQQELKEFIL